MILMQNFYISWTRDRNVSLALASAKWRNIQKQQLLSSKPNWPWFIIPISFFQLFSLQHHFIILETKLAQHSAVLIACCFKHLRLSPQPRCVIHKNTVPCVNYKIVSYVHSYLTFYPPTFLYWVHPGPWEPINICSAPCWVNKQLVEKTDYLVNGNFILLGIFLPFHCACSLPSSREGTAERQVVLKIQDFQCVAKATL